MRVPQEVRDCVVYLCEESGRPIGTGFLVGLPVSEGRSFAYVVTAAHIIQGLSKVLIRFNLTSGATDSIETSVPLDWWVSENPSSDVACFHFLGRDDLSISMVHPKNIADDEFLAKRDVGPGDDVVLTGLFTRTPGQGKNLPIVRFGQIARMNEETIVQVTARPDEFKELDAIIVETHSQGGNSGSPAFVIFPLARYMGSLELSQIGKSEPSTYWALLGLVSGHWDFLLPESSLGMKDAPVNSGMALVVPGQHILDLLNRADVVRYRTELLNKPEGQ